VRSNRWWNDLEKAYANLFRRLNLSSRIVSYRSTTLINNGSTTKFPTSPPIMVRLTIVPK
jgi:hypothetical protein